MSIFDNLLNKHFGPIFVKENSDAQDFLEKMKSLAVKASGELKDKIDEQIQLAEAGLYGENQIAYELKYSGMDMLIAHDVYFEHDNLTAQIDFLVQTHKHFFLIECKNLFGNIEIDDKGNFIRHMNFGKHYKKEGIYSPITQNERHLNVLKEVRREVKNNVLAKLFYDSSFPKYYKSVIVLANAKTVLNDKNAPDDIRKKIIRADQLISYIKEVEESDDNLSSNEKDMRELMQFYMDRTVPCKSDYSRKYEEALAECNAIPADDSKYMPPELKQQTEGEVPETSGKICPRCGKPLVLRTAKKGDKAGNQFWGCSGFPKCRFVEKRT